MRKQRKFIIGGLVGAGVIAVIAAILRPKPLEVEWDVARRDTLRVVTQAEAQARSRSRYVITAPVSGRVERIVLNAGDSVRAGTVVARMAPMPLDRLALDQARSRVLAAEATLRQAQAFEAQATTSARLAARDAERARAVEAAGGLSRQQRESADANASARADELVAAQSRLAAAAADVRSARAMVQSNHPNAPAMVIRSPVRGRVLRVPEISERVTQAGAPLLELGDATDLEIVADLLSTDAVRIPERARVELDGWGGDTALQARVRLVEPIATTRVSALGVDEQRVNVIIEPLARSRTLGDGYRLTANILLWEGRDVLRLPASAVFKEGSDWTVFVADDGRARARTLRLGHRSESAVEVLSGVGVGDTVVLFPSDRVREGVRLRLR